MPSRCRHTTPCSTGKGRLVSSGLSGDIYFVSPVEAAHRVLGADGDDLDQVCPAFSPDGARLASGQASGHSQIGWRHPALVITDLIASGEPVTSSVFRLAALPLRRAPYGRLTAAGSPSTRRSGAVSPGARGAPSGSWRSPRARSAGSQRSRRPTSNGHRTGRTVRCGPARHRRLLHRYPSDTDDLRHGRLRRSHGIAGRHGARVERRLLAWDEYELWLIGADGSDRGLIAEKYTHHEWAIGPRLVARRHADRLPKEHRRSGARRS